MSNRVEKIGDATLYLGDCLDVLPTLSGVDAVVTDPPYGIGENARKVASRCSRGIVKSYGEFSWDEKPCSQDAIAAMLAISKWQIIFGGNYFHLPPSRCWLVWDKLNSGDFADCELAWTNLQKAVRIHRHRWNGMIREGQEERFHPTQKPLGVMLWAISHLPDESKTVLDPFAGSGTTGVACLRTGRKFIGIEKEPKYFACKRLQAELDRSALFAGLPEEPVTPADLFQGSE